MRVALLKMFSEAASSCALVLALAGAALGGGPHPTPPPEPELHSLVPLGAEAFVVGPAKQFFAIFATAESSSFDGMRLVGEPGRRQMLDRNGKRMSIYPSDLSFRVTASGKVKLVSDDTPYMLPADAALEPLLRSFHFQLKVFHGLQARTVQPASVRMIGMPADVPYDERIYQLQFAIGHVPTDDKIVLEVLTPDSTRLCKFHLDFN